MDAVVDACGSTERAMGWYYYLDGKITVPFKARCRLARPDRPRRYGARATAHRIYDEVPESIVGSLANARRNLTNTRVSALEFIEILRSQTLTRLAQQAQKHVADL